MNNDLLPPIISDLVNQVRDKTTPMHIRDNVCSRLEMIAKATTSAVEAFRKEHTHFNIVKSKRKA